MGALERITRRIVALRRPKPMCPHCCKRLRVTPAGTFCLHPIVLRWRTTACRGSGAAAFASRATSG